jgi:hypothetical protein
MKAISLRNATEHAHYFILALAVTVLPVHSPNSAAESKPWRFNVHARESQIL